MFKSWVQTGPPPHRHQKPRHQKPRTCFPWTQATRKDMAHDLCSAKQDGKKEVWHLFRYHPSQEHSMPSERSSGTQKAWPITFSVVPPAHISLVLVYLLSLVNSTKYLISFQSIPFLLRINKITLWHETLDQQLLKWGDFRQQM